MNPKNVNDLDPKLKETYERVMGTSFAASPPTPPAMETQPVEQTPVPSAQPQKEPEPQVPASSPPIENSTVSQVFRADNSNKTVETATVNPPPDNKTAIKAGGKKSLPIIIAVGAIVFFAVYALIWAKVLGLF